jgi:hypothetical protein
MLHSKASKFAVLTDADQCRATGIWPARPMTPFEPPPSPLRPRRPPRLSVARRALEIAWGLIVALVLLSAAGGIAYVLATRQT